MWNVVAAPELSLQLQTWCFPVVGCVGYRGYFDRARADAEAAELRKQGLEVSVYGVPAYSTLGWLNWLGGDPLLNTFIRYPEGELARLIFHELAHQVAYAKGDTLFNESFATSVEQIGGRMWLQQHADAKAREEYARGFLVPARAVYLRGEQHYVFIDQGNGRYARRAIVAGPLADGYQVVLQGLGANDKVVLDGSLLLERLLASKD